MLLSRHNPLTWRVWCVAAVAFNLVLWASVIRFAEMASKWISAAS